MNRKQQLEQIIKKNNTLYWDGGQPQIQDSVYDQYIEQLKQIDPENPLVTQVIDRKNISSSKKIHHKNPMLSLDKVYSLQELKIWVQKKSRNQDELFLIQPKYDGISGKVQNYDACLPFNFEKFILSTRGNGSVGQNISDKLPIINFISHKIQTNEMYGEIIITNDDFANIFSKIISPSTKKCYKNARNATAGIMGTDDISFFKQQGAKLTFIDYDLISFQVKSNQFVEKWQTICGKIQQLPYPMDGIVIKIKDQEYGKSLGVTAHHPKNSIAFKFTNPKKETKLIDVQWSAGKNCLTPVAIFEPIQLDGITINRASLANYCNLKNLQLFIGDYVVVERAGRVIPHIIAVKKNENQAERKSPFISHCPYCGSQTIQKTPELVCQNENCIAKKIRQLLFSIKTIGIQNVGIPTIQKIISCIKIHNLYDFMLLTKEDLINCGFGEKTVENIYNEIQNHKSINDYQFFASLNIEGVGEQVAKLILRNIPINQLVSLNSEYKLLNIKGIGDVLAKKIIKYFQNNAEYIQSLLKLFCLQVTKNVDEITDTVCFTGAMQHPRKYYENIAIGKGITPVSSVNSKLTYLVANDVHSGSSKIKKAEKLKIKIITVEQFLNL